MYNSELKTAYIEQKTDKSTLRHECRVLFDKCARYEESFGGDLCTMPADVLRPILEELTGIRSRSFLPRIITLRDYCSWCVLSGVQGARNDIRDIRPSGLEKVKTSMVSGPIHLQKYLDEICDGDSAKSIDCIYRCYYWLSFAGMEEEDILRVQGKNIDFENMEAHFEGVDYPLYREAIESFRNAVFLKDFVYSNPQYPDILRSRVDGDILMRGIRGTVTSKSIRVELSRRSRRAYDAGVTDQRLSHYRVWLSGLFYRMYEKERAGYPVSFKSAAEAHMDGSEYKLDSGRNTIEAKMAQIMRDYQNDYDRWKIVFQ